MLSHNTTIAGLIWTRKIYAIYNRPSNFQLSRTGHKQRLPSLSKVLLEKLTVSQLVEKFPACYGRRRFSAFTTARHLSLPWARSIHLTPSNPTSWRSILILSSHLSLRLPSGPFLSRFPNKSLSPKISRCYKWVPVTMAWRVLRLRMEERPPIWRVAANKLNKQSRTADEGWSFRFGVGRGANNVSPWIPMLWNTHKARCFLLRQNNSLGG